MKKTTKTVGEFIKSHPMISFLLSLLIIFVIIFISSRFRENVSEGVETGEFTKKVSTIQVKDRQFVNLSGKIEKDGVVTIYAQTSGVVNNVYFEEGEKINKGNKIAYIADNYSGSSASSVAYQIAERQVQNQDATFKKQMDIIDDYKDDVKKTNSTDAKIARRQYSIQKRNVELQYDLTNLQKQQAAINTLSHTPTSPFAGTVERVFVSKGEMISAGSKIVVVNSDDKKLSVEVKISPALASVIDVESASTIKIGDKKVEVLPTYLSKSEVDNQSYALIFDLDDKYIDKVVNNEFVDLSIPVNVSVAEGEFLLPFDSVRLMSDGAIVFVSENGVAKARKIETGEVVGNFIVVRGGISEDDLIITDRNVFDGDKLER